MKKQILQRIGNRISKKYGMPNPIIEKRKEKNNCYGGYEIRTELPSYEGGFELQKAITKKYNNVIVENQGGCIYFAYIP